MNPEFITKCLSQIHLAYLFIIGAGFFFYDQIFIKPMRKCISDQQKILPKLDKTIALINQRTIIIQKQFEDHIMKNIPS